MLLYSVNVRQSAATAAGAIVWGLHNPSTTKTIIVPSMQLQLFFDGVAAATDMKYEMVKYTGVTSFSGGAAVTPMFKRTALSGSVVGVARVLDTGLTATGGTAQAVVPVGTMGRVTQTATNFQSVPLSILGRDVLNASAIELAANELLALRQAVVSVIGDNVVGFVEALEI